MCFFHFFKILIFWVVRGVKVQIMVLNDKKFCSSHSISKGPYIIWLSFMVHMCKMIISPGVFFILSKFWFFRFLGSKRAKNNLKLPTSVCFALDLMNCRSYWDFDNDIYRCFSLVFFKKCNIINIKIVLFFIGLLQQFF